MESKKISFILSVLGILSLVLITAGVTTAVFTYTKLGTTENVISVGKVEFLYTENATGGHGISLTNALPVNDQIGKNYAGDNYVFDFKVEGANSSSTEAIPYEVTLREKNGDNTLSGDIIKVYLTDGQETLDANGNLVANKVFVEPTLYDALPATSVDVGNDIVEKKLFTGVVPVNSIGSTKYSQNFRLKMWIDESADFNPVVTTQMVDDGTGNLVPTEVVTYPNSGKTFTATVNVYSNVKTVSVGN